MPVRRILLIDDDATVRDVVTCCLARTDYELDAPAVDRRHVSAAAMNTILNGRYDLLSLDLELPYLSPIEILDRLATADIPTEPVAFAAFLPEEIRADLRVHGCTRFIEKPFTVGELLGTINASPVDA